MADTSKLAARYGVIAGNPSINHAIYRAFGDLPDAVAEKVAKRLKQQADAKQDQVMHTFRELLIGAHLARSGYEVDYERPVSGKTPDWTTIGEQQDPTGIVEVVNHNLAADIARKIEAANAEGQLHVYYPEDEKRLFDKVDGKVGQYEKTVRDHDIPLVVAVFAGFDTGVGEDDLAMCVGPDEHSVFQQRPALSGLLLMETGSPVDLAALARGGTAFPPGYRYQFRYIANPIAERPFSVPSGEWRYAGPVS